MRQLTLAFISGFVVWLVYQNGFYAVVVFWLSLIGLYVQSIYKMLSEE